ncbi:MAG TPA: cysteine dioxygenase family protein [Candidatus Acidoferrales bacterium]|nr:cysteine dioxygenase family protein [Candidatus Acidoferrales bacterium]
MKTLGTDAALHPVVAPIAQAIADDRVTTLAAVLSRLCAQGALGPELFLPPRPERYARNLVWLDPGKRFVVVGMTWAVGQGSPLHDHAGLWGAEIVVDGVMNETTFALLERSQDGRYRFERSVHRVSGSGAIGILNPPLEYHEFGNGGSTVAHTLHVYSGDLRSAQCFAQDSDGWWTARRVNLSYA